CCDTIEPALMNQLFCHTRLTKNVTTAPTRIPQNTRASVILLFCVCARELCRGGERMSPVEIPLLQDAHQTAGQNIQRQAARKRKYYEHDGKAERHDLEHLRLLRVA